MRRVPIIFFMLLFFLPLKVFSQNLIEADKKVLVDSILALRGEAYLAIPTSARKSFIPLIESISPAKQTDSLLYFYVNSEQFRLFRDSGLEYQIFSAPSMDGPVIMAGSSDEVLSGQAYPTYSQYLELMEQFRTDYPGICTIDTIGYSINGRLILAARMQNGTYNKGNRPVVFYSSTMHGDEVIGYSLMLMLINDILTKSQSSVQISSILNELVLIINPLSNPDGTYFQSDTSFYGAKRSNNNNIDLNRNFPDVTKGMDYSVKDLQQENLAMVHYLEKFRPSLSVNFHSGAEVLNYPWDSWFSYEYKHADDNWFIEICKDYVDTARSIDPNYLRTYSDGYVFGSDWYWIPRGRQDFVTYCLRGREITIELSNVFIPHVSQIPGYWAKNRSALINYIENARYGVYGTFLDSITLEPVAARVEIPGYDKNESQVYSNPEAGKFFRFLPAGTYNMLISATGYQNKAITVEIGKKQRTESELKLVPFRTGIVVKATPGNFGLTIGLNGDSSKTFTADIFDLEGRKVQERIFNGNSGTMEGIMLNGIFILRVRSDFQSVSQLVYFNTP